jgi:hypothetical protein
MIGIGRSSAVSAFGTAVRAESQPVPRMKVMRGHDAVILVTAHQWRA